MNSTASSRSEMVDPCSAEPCWLDNFPLGPHSLLMPSRVDFRFFNSRENKPNSFFASLATPMELSYSCIAILMTAIASPIPPVKDIIRLGVIR